MLVPNVSARKTAQATELKKVKNKMRTDKLKTLWLILIIYLSAAVISAQQTTDVQASGGTFMLEKSVIAGGGSRMQQNQMNAANTVGQAVAGKQSSGGNFTLYSGFWTPDNLAPTAANVIVGGRIKTADGRGIQKVRVTITYPDGRTQTALSTSFGNYQFAEIPVGAVYIISITAKKYVFSQPVQIRMILDALQDIDFTAEILP